MRKVAIFMTGFLMTAGLPLRAAPVLNLTLDAVVSDALAHSPELQAAKKEAAAAMSQALAQKGPLYPRLSLDGWYRYQAVVPEFKPSPLSPTVQLGDNDNSSVGPVLSWMVFDTFGTVNRWRSAEAKAKARLYDVEALRRNETLQAREAYFRVTLAAENICFIADGLKLASDQYNDIRLQQKAGMASRMDALMAHQEVLARRRELRQARTALASALRDVFKKTGKGGELDPSVPTDVRLKDTMPPEAEAATLLVSAESPAVLKSRLNSTVPYVFDDQNPFLVALDESVAASVFATKSLSSGYGPSVNLSGKISRDYPNGPALEVITQKTFGVQASWPLYEGGRVKNEVAAQKSVTGALQSQKDERMERLVRNFQTATDALLGFNAERVIVAEETKEAGDLAALLYESYRAGHTRLLEVEIANLNVLKAQQDLLRTDVQILLQDAILESLSRSR